jgi:hypothetical protein
MRYGPVECDLVFVDLLQMANFAIAWPSTDISLVKFALQTGRWRGPPVGQIPLKFCHVMHSLRVG